MYVPLSDTEMEAKSRLYGPVVAADWIASPSNVKLGAAPLEPTQGRLTASPSVTEMVVGGARMMISLSPRDDPSRKIIA